ncbi:threonine dehydratase [Atopomonas hussainii]|uniref:Threonine dehydratase n=1 Tax=Atopomonas hussainii TaxID=1429083 RepID=A0A1H7QW68_9GAMM|nr:threonine dehydratase [Atopomonas hussainii]SEL51944.1 threonine dehydratase [Atopomonas hussainii]
MQLPNAEQLRAAQAVVYQRLQPTAQYRWPLLAEALGTPVWVKHENHGALGAFKQRGGLNYLQQLLQREPHVAGLVSATRGNHGQSLAAAAALYNLPLQIVVPHGNSQEKNAAMRALGAELIEHGDDFQAACEHAAQLAETSGWHRVPAFHPDLIAGVASYCLELLSAAPQLARVYVPIGMGSGICAMLAARAALQHSVEVIGVVSKHAPAYARAFTSGERQCIASQTLLADGMACSTPDPQALRWIREGVSRIVEVSDREVAAAMRLLFSATHNVAEGAGAASLAAALQEREQHHGAEIGVIISGGNVDSRLYAQVLAEQLDLLG